MSLELEELTQDKVEEMILQQGHHVLQILNSQGWQLIENCLKISKARAEKNRKKEMRLQCNREKMLYWNGVVDGVQESIDEIYNIVTEAKNVEAKRNHETQQEEL